MAKWGTYPPDEQLRLKRDAAEELYEALADLVADLPARLEVSELIRVSAYYKALRALAKARGGA